MSLLFVNAAYCDTVEIDGGFTHKFMVSVHDADGMPVSGLTSANFHICIEHPFYSASVKPIFDFIELPMHLGRYPDHSGFYRIAVSFNLPVPGSKAWNETTSGTCGIEVTHDNKNTDTTDRGRTIIGSQLIMTKTPWLNHPILS
jgi:hypothetical protein